MRARQLILDLEQLVTLRDVDLELVRVQLVAVVLEHVVLRVQDAVLDLRHHARLKSARVRSHRLLLQVVHIARHQVVALRLSLKRTPARDKHLLVVNLLQILIVVLRAGL